MVFNRWPIKCHPLVQAILIISFWMLIDYSVHILSGIKRIHVKWILVPAFHIYIWSTQTLQWSMVNCTVDIFLEFHQLSTNIDCYRVLSYDMLSRLLIIQKMKLILTNKNQLFYTKVYNFEISHSTLHVFTYFHCIVLFFIFSAYT